MKLVVIKKAWKLFYKESIRYSEDYDYCPSHPFECFAETRNKAKHNFWCNSWDVSVNK